MISLSQLYKLSRKRPFLPFTPSSHIQYALTPVRVTNARFRSIKRHIPFCPICSPGSLKKITYIFYYVEDIVIRRRFQRIAPSIAAVLSYFTISRVIIAQCISSASFSSVLLTVPYSPIVPHLPIAPRGVRLSSPLVHPVIIRCFLRAPVPFLSPVSPAYSTFFSLCSHDRRCRRVSGHR